jgi:hypothetical protein
MQALVAVVDFGRTAEIVWFDTPTLSGRDRFYRFGTGMDGQVVEADAEGYALPDELKMKIPLPALYALIAAVRKLDGLPQDVDAFVHDQLKREQATVDKLLAHVLDRGDT